MAFANYRESKPKMSHRLLLAAVSVAALSSTAHAQSVNYVDLQAAFGEPVTTSVIGKPQRASDAAASLIIITQDEIRRSPAKDIPGLIATYAGVDVARWTSGYSDVNIRGGVRPGNPSLLVLVNGRQVYLDHYGLTGWNNLGVQLGDIQQIEVVKGPNSALFGFNAASGVINIVTVNALQSQQVSATIEGGNAGHIRAEGSAAVKLADRIGVRLSAGYEKNHEFESIKAVALPAPGQHADHPERKEVSGDLTVKLDDVTEAGLSGGYSKSNDIFYVPSLLFSEERMTTKSAGLKLARDMGWGTLSAKIYQNWLDIDFDSKFAGTPSLFMKNKVFNAATEALVRADGHNTFRIGLEYRTNTLHSVPGYDGDTSYKVFSGSLMWNGELNDMFTLTTAGRIDHLKLRQDGFNAPSVFTAADYDRSLTAWSFNGALLVKVDDNGTMRIAAGRGIQTPSLVSLGARIATNLPGVPVPYIYTGNPKLDPAIVWNGEIGYTRSLSGIGGTLDLTGFFTRTSDVISSPVFGAAPIYAPPAYPFVSSPFDNIGHYDSYGVEASLKGTISPQWRWSVNYTWNALDAQIRGNSGATFTYPLSPETTTPEHKVNAQATFESGPWLATGVVRYISGTEQLFGQVNPVLYHIDAHVTLDAKIGFRIGEHATVSISGENLTKKGETFTTERRYRAALQAKF